MGVDWDDDTKIASKGESSTPDASDRDRAYLIVLAGTSVGEMYKISSSETIIGRGQQADIQVIDEGISRRHAKLLRQSSDVVIQDLGSTNGTFVNGHRVVEQALSDGDKIQVGSTTILKFTFHDSLDETFQRQMYESALRDGLTKLFNKKYFLDRLEGEFAFAVRHRAPLSLVLFDVDHFKKINDSHGHLAGDHALQTLAQAVAENTRQEDVFARYGGEEFAVICRGIDLAGGTTFGERIRGCVEHATLVHNGVTIRMTVSVGVAAVADGMHQALELITQADEALYQAKRAGRNRVVTASHVTSPATASPATASPPSRVKG